MDDTPLRGLISLHTLDMFQQLAPHDSPKLLHECAHRDLRTMCVPLHTRVKRLPRISNSVINQHYYYIGLSLFPPIIPYSVNGIGVFRQIVGYYASNIESDSLSLISKDKQYTKHHVEQCTQ